MKPEIQVLVALAEEAKRMESEAIEAKEEKLALMLNFRRQEINNVLAVAKLWDSDPPTKDDPQESLDDYLKATLYVAESIRKLVEDRLYMGNHEGHFEREWAGSVDCEE